MTDLQQQKKMREEIAVQSDAYIADARRFVQDHKFLLRDMTNNQLYGLLNIVRNISNLDAIGEYATNQAKKAREAGKRMEAFWQNWDKKQRMIRADGLKLIKGVKSSWVSDEERVERITKTLFVKYVQHMIAEKLVLESSFR